MKLMAADRMWLPLLVLLFAEAEAVGLRNSRSASGVARTVSSSTDDDNTAIHEELGEHVQDAGDAVQSADIDDVLMPACSCADCLGHPDTSGKDYWTCHPDIAKHPDEANCRQLEHSSEFVVQSEEIALTRFCRYTCKPVVPEKLVPEVSCERLSRDVIHKFAQTPSGNGRAFLWKAHRMADSLTLADVADVTGSTGGGDGRSMEERIAATFRTKKRTLTAYEPGCHCNCGANATTPVLAPGQAPPPPVLPMGPVGQYAINAEIAAKDAAAAAAAHAAYLAAGGQAAYAVPPPIPQGDFRGDTIILPAPAGSFFR
jgi:hypothetical protein